MDHVERQQARVRLGLGVLAAAAIVMMVGSLWGLGSQRWIEWLLKHFEGDHDKAYFYFGLPRLVLDVVETTLFLVGVSLLRAHARARGAAVAAMALFIAVLALFGVRVLMAIVEPSFGDGATGRLLYSALFDWVYVIAIGGLLATGLALRALAAGRRSRDAALAIVLLAAVALPIVMWNSLAVPGEHIDARWGLRINLWALELILLVLVLVLRHRPRPKLPTAIVRAGLVALVLLVPTTTLAAPKADDELAAITALRDSGKTSAALERWQAAVAKHPAHPPLRTLGAELLFRANRVGEARTMIETAIASGDGRADAHALHGQILYFLGEDEAARAPLDRALAIDPDHASARETLTFVDRLAAIRRPGGQPDPDSAPARVVDGLLRAADEGWLGAAFAEKIHPLLYERLAIAAGQEGSGSSLRETLATALDAELAKQRARLPTIVGYRIVSATERGETASVVVEVASVATVSKQDVDEIRRSLASASRVEDVFEKDTAELYQQLDEPDRARFVDAFEGRRELAFEELTFQLRALEGAWLVEDITLPQGMGLTRSFASEIERPLRIAAGMSKAIADSVERHQPRRWHPLAIATLVGSLGVLIWLAVRLALGSRS